MRRMPKSEDWTMAMAYFTLKAKEEEEWREEQKQGEQGSGSPNRAHLGRPNA
jgi:hypothetical protein